MVLVDMARNVAAAARHIPDDFGLRQYSVVLRVTTLIAGTWASGTTSVDDTEITPRPRVRVAPPDSPSWAAADQLLSQGGRVPVRAVYEIGPLTPRSASPVSGQYDPSDLLTPDAAGPSTTRKISVVLTGPDTPSSGAVCQIIAIDTTAAIHWTMTVGRTSA